eukprot:NODE_786_length_3896_cov_0.394785.p1 type:complete len:564 gc:universal NODE_786_length_3896_cov_0.394785:2284-593(-)
MSDNEFYSEDEFEGSLDEEMDRPRNQFILDEAESDEGEEEEEYYDEEIGEADEVEEYESAMKKAIPKRREEREMDPEAIAARLEAKYGGQNYDEPNQYYAPAEGASNMKYYPRSLLMPERQDPSLFVVKCVPGRETQIILNLMKNPQKIISCFFRDHIKGYIYVEAFQKQHVVQAVENVPFALKKCTVVPLTEMPQCLKDNKEENVNSGMWIRCKRGKYKMDVARIVAVSPTRESVRIQLVPRVDTSAPEYDDQGKRIKNAGRPKARKFDVKDLTSTLKKQVTRNNRGYYILGNDSFKDGYLEKEIKISNLILDARPTRKEISDFYKKGGRLNVDFDAETNEQLRQSEQAFVKAGDLVMVFRGELYNLHGKVESVERKLASVKLLKDIPDGPPRNTILHFPVDDLRKTFEEGSHVKVLVGAHKNETGMVVKADADVVSILLDGSHDQIDISPHEVAESFDISSKIVSFEPTLEKAAKDIYGVQDLIKYFKGAKIVFGCIFQMVNDKFVVLNQFNQVETVRRAQILDHRQRKSKTIKTGKGVDGYVTRDVQYRAITNGDTVLIY